MKKDKKEVADIEEMEVKEIIVEKKSGFNYIEVVIIMLISLVIGGVVGSFINFDYKANNKISVDNNTTAKIPEGFNEFLQAYDNIVNNYYEDVDSKKLIEAGINGMLEYLGDDYSVYMDKEATEKFNTQVEGKYKGIGVEIGLLDEGGVTITEIFENSPAERAGLKKDDIFVSINGVDVSKNNVLEVSKLIKESENKEIVVVVKRDGIEKNFTLSLDDVAIDSVTTKVYETKGKKIGYIRLNVFASNTYKQFEKKLPELENKNIDNLIIDVRSNSGGYLSSVTNIASMFLPKNKIIYQLDTKGVIEQIFSKTKESRNYKVVVLIDKASASAAEILAAAMKESYGATIIGTNSFGKGTVQAAYQLHSGATVKYTIQKWLTPKGNWINKVGLKPDIEVELTDDYLNNPSDQTDTQLQKALEELSK